MITRFGNPGDFHTSNIHTPSDDQIARYTSARARFNELLTTYTQARDEIAAAYQTRNAVWRVPQPMQTLDADLPYIQDDGGRDAPGRLDAASRKLEAFVHDLAQQTQLLREKNVEAAVRELGASRNRLLGGSRTPPFTEVIGTAFKLSRVYATAFMPVALVTKALILAINESSATPGTKAFLVDVVQVLGLLASSWLHERAQVAAGFTVSMYTRPRTNGLVADILTEDAPWFVFAAAKMIMTTINASSERAGLTPLSTGVVDIAVTPLVMWLVAGVGTPLVQQTCRAYVTHRGSQRSTPKLPDSWSCGDYLKLLSGCAVRTPGGEELSVTLNTGTGTGNHLYRHRGSFSAASKAMLLGSWYWCNLTWIPLLWSPPSADPLIADSLAKVFNSTGDGDHDMAAMFLANQTVRAKLEEMLSPSLLREFTHTLNQTLIPSKGVMTPMLNSESKFDRGIFSDFLFIGFFSAHEHMARLLRHVFGIDPHAVPHPVPVQNQVEVQQGQIIRETQLGPVQKYEDTSAVTRRLSDFRLEIGPTVRGQLSGLDQEV